MASPRLLAKLVEGEMLILYLAISEYLVNVVLVREEGGSQFLIYYVRRRLLDAETRYSNMEKFGIFSNLGI